MSRDKKHEPFFSSWLDVTDFGAAGNGVNDDSKAINDAISRAEEAGGGTIFFPKGIFKCMSIRPKSGVTLQGLGWGASVLKGFDDQSDNAIIDGTGYFTQESPLERFNVKNIELDGSEMNRQGYHYNRKGIGHQWLKNCLFESVYVHNTPATGFGTDFTVNVAFLDCLTRKCGTQGKVGNGIGSNGFGIGVSDVTEVVVFVNCQALEIANNGFTLEAQETQGVGYATVTNCYTEKCGNAGYSNSGSQRVDIIGCADNSSMYGVYVSANAAQPSDQTILTGCEFVDQISHGVYSDQSANNHLEVKDCLFNACRGSGIKNLGSYCSISDNTFKDCKEATILCAPAKGAIGKGYLITDNVIIYSKSVGIQIDSTNQAISGLIVKENLIQDCRDAAIKVICKPGISTGNISAAVIEGNVCDSPFKPQIEIMGKSRNIVVRNNVGYNPVGVSSIIPNESPHVYRAGNSPEDIYIDGAGVSKVLVDSIELFTASPCSLHLEPNQMLTINYTSKPKIVRSIL